jgi:hypothetical protein
MGWISARRIGKSAGLGLLAAVVFAAVAILLVPAIGYPILFAPGALLAPVLGPMFEVIATRFEIDGGAELGVGLLLVCSLSFWWLIFTAVIGVLRNDPVA